MNPISMLNDTEVFQFEAPKREVIIASGGAEDVEAFKDEQNEEEIGEAVAVGAAVAGALTKIAERNDEQYDYE
uniref:Uncharacterized protein n=1 Tax=Plectus sambesii TaxID=2011161 RepID=A0A914VMN6_9BILA